MNRRDVLKTSAGSTGSGSVAGRSGGGLSQGSQHELESFDAARLPTCASRRSSSPAPAPVRSFASIPTRASMDSAKFATAPAQLTLCFSRAAFSARTRCNSTRFFARSSNLAVPRARVAECAPSKWRCGTLPARSTTRPCMPWWAVASSATRFASMPTPPNPRIPKSTPSA